MKIFEISKFLEREETAIQYLLDNQILKPDKKCWKCKSTMNLVLELKQYRCSKRSCRKHASIFKSTFFSTSKIKIHVLLWLSYLYLFKMPINSLILITGLGSEAITAWTKFLRQLLADSINYSEVKIGGPGIVVEIDETKLGKRKYHRGHRVEGVWVVAGIERTEQKKVFLQEVQDRTYDTLVELFRTYVLPGSIVHTDGWAPYLRVCRELNLEHKTVNHTYYFKDPITGTHTNTVEGLNNGIKSLIKPRNRVKNNINDWLYYFIWRRINKKNIWIGFLKALKEIIY